MPLNLDDIKRIAASTAEEIAGEIRKHQCRCGSTVWLKKLDFDALALAVEIQNESRIGDELKYVEESIKKIEDDCNINLDFSREWLEKVMPAVKKLNFEAALRSLVLAKSGVISTLMEYSLTKEDIELK